MKKFTDDSTRLIKIDYSDLINHDMNLNHLIKDSFGPESLGLIIIKNSGIAELRKNILLNGLKLGKLDIDYLKNLEKPELKYNLGWSKGKSYVENKWEYLTGSFYARIFNERLVYPSDPEMEIKYTNIWPELLPNFKEDFISIGKSLYNIQINLLKHIDRYIKSVIPDYEENMLFDTFTKSNDVLGRLLVYYPHSTIDDKISNYSFDDNWCGWHRDFGITTALTHPMYFNKDGEILKAIKSGLLVKDRKGKINDIMYDEDEIAIQAGDVLYLLSGGSIISTPHAVKIREGIPKDAYRVTFVNFLEPNYEYKIYTTKGISEEDIFANDPFKMQDTYTKFTQGCTYKDLIFGALAKYFPTEFKEI